MIRSILFIAFTVLMLSCNNNGQASSAGDSVSVLQDDTASLPEVDTLAPADIPGQVSDSSRLQ